MTTREVVAELRQKGHHIKYRVRKDGGILITSMDRVKYTGAAGNKIARNLLADKAQLSQARRTQLKIIRPSKGKKPGQDVLDEKIKAEIKRIQKIYSKNKVPISQGRITRRLIRKIIEEEGKEAAMAKLARAERYASGYATSRTIEALCQYIEFLGQVVDDPSDLFDLAEDIRANDGRIRDEDIKPAYDMLYMLNKGMPVEDVINNVRRILKI